jgi:hypothetical protein
MFVVTIGIVHYELGNFERAQFWLDLGLTDVRQHGERGLEATTLQALARLAIARHKSNVARERIGEAPARANALSPPALQLPIVSIHAKLLAAEGETRRAGALWRWVRLHLASTLRTKAKPSASWLHSPQRAATPRPTASSEPPYDERQLQTVRPLTGHLGAPRATRQYPLFRRRQFFQQGRVLMQCCARPRNNELTSRVRVEMRNDRSASDQAGRLRVDGGSTCLRIDVAGACALVAAYARA